MRHYGEDHRDFRTRGRAGGRAMNALRGTIALTGLALTRDRFKLPAYVLGPAVLMAGMVADVADRHAPSSRRGDRALCAHAGPADIRCRLRREHRLRLHDPRLPAARGAGRADERPCRRAPHPPERGDRPRRAGRRGRRRPARRPGRRTHRHGRRQPRTGRAAGAGRDRHRAARRGLVHGRTRDRRLRDRVRRCRRCQRAALVDHTGSERSRCRGTRAGVRGQRPREHARHRRRERPASCERLAGVVVPDGLGPADAPVRRRHLVAARPVRSRLRRPGRCSEPARNPARRREWHPRRSTRTRRGRRPAPQSARARVAPAARRLARMGGRLGRIRPHLRCHHRRDQGHGGRDGRLVRADDRVGRDGRGLGHLDGRDGRHGRRGLRSSDPAPDARRGSRRSVWNPSWRPR